MLLKQLGLPEWLAVSVSKKRRLRKRSNSYCFITSSSKIPGQLNGSETDHSRRRYGEKEASAGVYLKNCAYRELNDGVH